MTTNAGAAELSKSAIGFERDTRDGEDAEAIKKLFTPEFRNRLDAIIGFAHLTPEIVTQIVDKFIIQLETQLADRRVSIELNDQAREWLGRKGYDKLYGARPLSRLIQEHIKKPLANELLFGKLAKGGIVKVAVKDDELTFTFKALPPKDKTGKKVPALVD